MEGRSPSPSLLALLATIAPVVASPISLPFLYPPSNLRRRWSDAAQAAAANLAYHYSPSEHGDYHPSCWELHGQTNCPRDGADLNDNFNVATGTADTVASSSTMPTPTPTTTSTSATSTTTASTAAFTAYTLDFDVANVPDGWQTTPRSQLYSKPFILGFSVTLAIVILVTIIGCVVWRIRASKSTPDVEKIPPLTPPLNDDTGQPSRKGLRRRKARPIPAASLIQPDNNIPEQEQETEKEKEKEGVRWSRGWAKASERWRVNARLAAKRRKVGFVKMPASTATVGEVDRVTPVPPIVVDVTPPTPQSSRSSLARVRRSTSGRRSSTPVVRSATPIASSSDQNWQSPPSRLYPQMPSMDLSSQPLIQPSTHVRSPFRHPLPLSDDDDADHDTQNEGTVSPPAYRRRGFTLLASPSMPSSSSQSRRNGKQREAGYADEEDVGAGSLQEDSTTLPSFDASSSRPEVGQRSMHVATDDKALLETIRVMRSRPPGSAPSEPVGLGVLEDASAPLDQDMSSYDNQEPLEISSIPTSPFPAPPTLTKAHQIPHLPSTPPHLTPESPPNSTFTDDLPFREKGKEKEGIGVLGPSAPFDMAEDLSMMLPSAPPAPEDDEGTTEAPSAPSSDEELPSAPPFDQVDDEDGPSAPPLPDDSDPTLSSKP